MKKLLLALGIIAIAVLVWFFSTQGVDTPKTEPLFGGVWSSEADFNDLSDGDLNGQAGGTGWTGNWGTDTDYDVQGTTVYEGTKAVIYNGTTGGNIQRALTSSVSGDSVIYFAIRAAQTNGGGARFQLNSRSHIQFDAVDTFGTVGNIYLLSSPSSAITLVSGYSANTWYVIRLTFNTTTGVHSAAVSTDAFGTDGTFGTESSSGTMFGTGDITLFQINTEGTSADYYLDYISDTSPFSAASSPSVESDVILFE